MNFLYVDLISGASGDMILSSLIHMGFPVQYCLDRINSLKIEKVSINAEMVERNGIRCTMIHPDWEPAHEYRHYTDIVKILRSGSIEESIVKRSETVFSALAHAEALVHGIPVENVHFHEIGALDTIIDIVGFCCAMEYFRVDKVYFSTLTDGYGTVNAAHGTMPIPVPAVSKLITGLKFKALPIESELLTPTGAALLVALGTQVESMPEGVILQTGYGCGSKVFNDHPNYLRSILCSRSVPVSENTDSVYVIESDMDHISGEIMGSTSKILFDRGALDVVWVPVYMKKCRPGYRLSVISKKESLQDLADCIIRETRTLGVRVHKSDRFIASREYVDISFSGELCREKRCSYKGYSFSKLEFDALESLSKSKGIIVQDLLEEYIRQKRTT